MYYIRRAGVYGLYCLDYTYLARFACVITGENFGRTLRRTEITEAPFQATCPKVGNKQVKSTTGH